MTPQELVQEFVEHGLLEDRLEYDTEDLARSYGLTSTEAQEVYDEIRRVAARQVW